MTQIELPKPAHIIQRKIDLRLIPKLSPIWTSKDTWIDCYGGRGGGKSYEVNTKMLFDAMMLPRNSLLASCREFQASIADSNHQVMTQKIYELELERDFDIQVSKIVCKRNGNEIKFVGLARNISSILSKANLKVMHLEEASYLSLNSFRLIIPTMSRNKGMRIYTTRNPRLRTDPTYQMFQATDAEREPDFKYDMRDRHTSIQINWNDNPWLTELTHPEWFSELRALYKHDRAEANHVYGGMLWNRTDALIYKPEQWQVMDANAWHVPSNAKTYAGLDIGDTSPTAGVLFHVCNGTRTIYIEHEFHQRKTNPFELAPAIAIALPGTGEGNVPVTADSNAPRVIREIQMDDRFNFKIRGAKKQPIRRADMPYLTSPVRQGILFNKGFELKLHPRCIHFKRELENYKYEIDDQTEIVLDRIMKTDDHLMDAWRYGMEEELNLAWGTTSLISGVM